MSRIFSALLFGINSGSIESIQYKYLKNIKYSIFFMLHVHIWFIFIEIYVAQSQFSIYFLSNSFKLFADLIFIKNYLTFIKDCRRCNLYNILSLNKFCMF